MGVSRPIKTANAFHCGKLAKNEWLGDSQTKNVVQTVYARISTLPGISHNTKAFDSHTQRHPPSPFIHIKLRTVHHPSTEQNIMPKRLVHLLVVTATCCSTATGFATPNTVPRIRLDLNFADAGTILPSMPESLIEVGVKDNENNLSTALPPVIQSIADERREFQMNLGKAMDTLRKDMPYILKQAPGK